MSGIALQPFFMVVDSGSPLDNALYYFSDHFRVRRSSDDAEQDFEAPSNIPTWTGASDGFLARWYDENNDSIYLQQAVAASQPKIVNGGSLLPMAEGDGNDLMSLDITGFSDGDPLSIFGQFNSSTSGRLLHLKGLELMRFNGSSNYIQLSDNAYNSHTAGAIEAYIYIEDLSTNFTILSAASSSDPAGMVYWRVSTDGLLEFINSGNTKKVSTTGIISEKQLTKVKIASDGTSYSMWIDDVAQTLTELGAGADNGNWWADEVVGTMRYAIGNIRRSSGNIAFANGVIYDLKIWDNTETLVGHWPGHGISSGDWEDQVGSNDGTVIGSPSLFGRSDLIIGLGASGGIYVSTDGENGSGYDDGEDHFFSLFLDPITETGALYVDGSLVSDSLAYTPILTGNLLSLTVFAEAEGSNALAGSIGSLALFNTNQSENRTEIENRL